MSLSPETAIRTIGAIIVPAVMISACAILLNGIILRYTAIDNLLRSFNQESLSLKQGNSQGNSGNGHASVERLHHLKHLTSKLLYHHHLLHNVLTLINLSLFIFVVDMLIVAVSMSAPVKWLSYLVLAIFLLAVGILCWSLFLAFYELRASHNFIQLELQITCQQCNSQRSMKHDRYSHSHLTCIK